MTAPLLVNTSMESNQRGVGLGTAVEAIDQLALQRGEEALHDRIDQQPTQVYRLANQRVSPAAKTPRVFFFI